MPLIDLVRSAAASSPERPVVVSPRGSLTYAACAERADMLAAGLRARSIERFGCVIRDEADLLTVLVASTATGSEACVYPATAEATQLLDLAAAFDHRVVVSDRDVGLPGVELLRPDDLAGDAPSESGPGAGSAPVLVLTTGTTGRPKGARHDWHRLVAAARPRAGRADARWLLAYNLNQFAGIQVLLHVLAAGATMVVPASNQPRDALDAMLAHKVTHASGTPTFWRFVVALLDDEAVGRLPLEQITLGGEAVPGPLLAALAERFHTARISQVYASTEFGSSVSVTDGRPGLPRSILDRGEEADVQFKVVDGELHARSRVGMLGYFGQAAGDDGWRPTGDLVEVTADRILFVGRSTEVINVGGVKVHPLPVEEAVQGVEGVVMAHVYGRPNPMAGHIVAVDIVAADGADVDAVEDGVRAACASLPPASQPRRIRFVDALSVRENKVVRGGGAPQGAAP